jgi:hypothetical protein
MVSKKIIIKDKDYTEMEAWEKIFFMFLNTKKSCASKTNIAEATKEYWNNRIATEKNYTDEENEIRDDTSQGTVSKHRETLEGIIVYKGKSYTIRKTTVKDKNGRDTDNKAYSLLEWDEQDQIWENGKDELREKGYLVENELCVVSKYMYVFKFNRGKRKQKSPLTDELQNELLSQNEKDIEKIIKIKNIFSGMINPDCLFDVSYFDGNIAIILRNTNQKNIERYSQYLEEFWKT